MSKATDNAAQLTHWVDACAIDDIDKEDVLRWDYGGKTYAIYHSPDGKLLCTNGLCTHENVHLAGGLVMNYVIECPKHNGQFDYRTGEAKRMPACIKLATYPVQVEDGRVLVRLF